MYPMDFEEWLWANGIKPMHIDYLRKCLDNVSPVDVSIHARFRELLNQYVIVGGMPEAVTAFLETKQIGKVLSIQRRIVDEYKTDMVKYALLADKPKIRECFESIPSQLSREYKKFTFSNVLSQLNVRLQQAMPSPCALSLGIRRNTTWILLSNLETTMSA